MGLGKTAITLSAVVDLLAQKQVKKVLIIAPLRVAINVWRQEAANWDHTKHLDVKVCTGSLSTRIKAFNGEHDVYVINRENMPWLVDHYQKNWPFDTVIVDEASSFKSPSSKRFKSLKKTLPYIERMVLLTGTPSPNGLMDLWSQMYLIDKGASLGRTLTSYRQRFFDQGYMGWTYTLKPGADKLIHAAVKDKVLSMSARDYLELPDKINLNTVVVMPTAQLKDYTRFERKLFINLDGDKIVPATAAVLANKLLQWANGAIYLDDGSYKVLHDLKLDALQDIVDDNPNENILVGYNYISDVERLMDKFPSAETLTTDPGTVKRWNGGKIKIFLCHPASGGHGLNLQEGGSILVWFGLPWSLELYQQFNARLHRQGQSKPVRIIHIITKGTIDERVIKVLAKKDATQLDLINAVK